MQRILPSYHIWRPLTDVYETEDAVIVRVEIAGVQEEDITVELNGHSLTIHGFRQDIAERRAYHQMEIHFGEFEFEIDLPLPVVAEQVEAAYNNGFLLITLPKAHPQHITLIQ